MCILWDQNQWPKIRASSTKVYGWTGGSLKDCNCSLWRFCYDYNSLIILDAAGGDKKPKWSLRWIVETKRTHLTVSTCQIFNTIFRFALNKTVNDFQLVKVPETDVVKCKHIVDRPPQSDFFFVFISCKCWQLFWKFNKICWFNWQNFGWAHWASNLAI